MKKNYDKILNAAIELMGKHGYHGTSVQMIADKIGVTKSTVFHYFKNKEGILFAILEDYIPSATKGFIQLANDGNINGIEKLKKFIRYHLNRVSETGDVLNLYLSESKYFGEENQKVIKKSQIEYAGLLQIIIRQIQKENSHIYKNLNPKILANAILGMCNWAVMWYDEDGKLGTEGIAKQFCELVLGNISKNNRFLKYY